MFLRRAKKQFTVLIIRPSKYDDEGYVIRYLRGVLPSNTVSVLSALTRQAFDSGRFDADLETQIVPLDDTVQSIDVRKLARRYLGKQRRAVVALAGVQSNQFPRASDLALRFKHAGFEVMIGGFHVSGSIAMSSEIPRECQALLDRGITLVKGEVEDRWADLLEQAWQGKLEPFYNIEEKPDITNAPIPLIDRRYQKRFAHSGYGTIDAGRGCPFGCSFCTIINVQGRRMRCRSAAAIRRQVIKNYHEHQIDYYFFTDDNFARNRNWEEIFDALIELREQEQIKLTFMMQVDTVAWKLPRFIEKARAAGCSQVFLGVESLNPENLTAVNKRQNAVGEMRDMVRAWHAAGVACHAGYIIGFPFDTPESVARDVEQLKATEMDQASFFMLVPLPGSADHARMVETGTYMDPDFNRYDSFHETLQLPGFAPGQWQQTYYDAWHSFYDFDNMSEILKRCNETTYWGIFKNFMWYRSALIERIHPMMSGFIRRRARKDRAPGFPIEGRIRHGLRITRATWQAWKAYYRLFFEMQELWLRTRIRREPGSVAGLRDRLEKNVSQWSESFNTRTGEMKESLDARAGNVRQSIEQRSSRAIEWVQNNLSEIRRAIGTYDENAIGWLQDGAEGIRHSLSEHRTSVREWVRNNTADIAETISVLGENARDWVQQSATELQARVRAGFTSIRDSKQVSHGDALVRAMSRALVRWNRVGKRRQITSRVPLSRYWSDLRGWLRQGRVMRLSFETPRIGLNFLRDLRLSITFIVYLKNELTCV